MSSFQIEKESIVTVISIYKKYSWNAKGTDTIYIIS